MSMFRKITLAGFAVFVALFSPVCAEIAAGTYRMEFDGDVSLWDISGTYSETIDGMTMDYTISVDPSGKIIGTGSMTMDNNLGDLDMDFTFSGTVKTSGTLTRVDLSITMKASGVAEGYPFTLKMAVKEKLEIDSDTRMMVGTMSGKISISVKGYGSESMKIDPTDVALELPFDMDGSWELVINSSAVGTKIAGTGAIILSNGSTYGFSVNGSYNASSDISKIALKGGAANKSMTVSIEAICAGPAITPRKLKGKALGQSLKFVGN